MFFAKKNCQSTCGVVALAATSAIARKKIADWSFWSKLGDERCAGIVLVFQPDRWARAFSWSSVLNQDVAGKSGRGRVVDEEEWSSVSSASNKGKGRRRTVDVSVSKMPSGKQHIVRFISCSGSSNLWSDRTVVRI